MGKELVDLERRAYAVELRVSAGDDGPMIEGYAAVFDVLSEDLGGFRERVRPGAFGASLVDADVRALWNHDPLYVLGRQKSETLKVWEDDHGLRFKVQPPEARWAEDLLASMRRKDVDQCSFAFRVVEDEWSMQGGMLQRDLLAVELFDVSVVTYPAYPQTSAQVRARLADLAEGSPDGEGQEEAARAQELELQRNQVRRLRLDVRG